MICLNWEIKCASLTLSFEGMCKIHLWQCKKGFCFTSKGRERAQGLPGYSRHETVIRSHINQPVTAKSMVLIVTQWAASGEFHHSLSVSWNNEILLQDTAPSESSEAPELKSLKHITQKLKVSNVVLFFSFLHFLQTFVLQWHAAQRGGGERVKYKQQSRYAQGPTVGSASCISCVPHADWVCESGHCSVSYSVPAACSMIAAPSSVTHRELGLDARQIQQAVIMVCSQLTVEQWIHIIHQIPVISSYHFGQWRLLTGGRIQTANGNKAMHVYLIWCVLISKYMW